MELLGRHSAELRSLVALARPEGRAERGLYIVEGPTLLEEARLSGVAVAAIYATPEALAREPQLAAARAEGVPIRLLDERSAQRLSDLEHPPGIFSLVPMLPSEPASILARNGLALLLADLNDPGNAGTLLRAAEAFGATGALLGDLGVDPYHPKLVRAAMGAHFRLPIARLSPPELAARLAEHPAHTIGLSADGAPIAGLPHRGARLLVVGNERHGLGRWAPLCRDLAAIPMPGRAESLNAGVAGAIALYELGAAGEGRGISGGLSRE
ncbi:MAG: TrmH family RNA methyltransferase [Candidatus Baltobacteraceae bacterium]